MTPALTTTALVLHDLGLATSFGGSLFGRYALHPAVRNIHDNKEKGEVVSSAWKTFSPVNTLSQLTFGLTWLAGRTFLTGRSIDKSTRALVFVKDALVATSVVSGLACQATGYALSRSDQGEQPPIYSGNESAIETPAQSQVLQQTTRALGIVNLIATASVVGITAVLLMKAGSSNRWSFVSRLLP